MSVSKERRRKEKEERRATDAEDVKRLNDHTWALECTVVVKNGSYDWSQGVAGEGLLEAGIVLNREQLVQYNYARETHWTSDYKITWIDMVGNEADKGWKGW